MANLKKELPIRLSICFLCILWFYFVILVISRFDFEGGVWVLIAQDPGHCILVTIIDLHIGKIAWCQPYHSFTGRI